MPMVVTDGIASVSRPIQHASTDKKKGGRVVSLGWERQMPAMLAIKCLHRWHPFLQTGWLISVNGEHGEVLDTAIGVVFPLLHAAFVRDKNDVVPRDVKGVHILRPIAIAVGA